MTGTLFFGAIFFTVIAVYFLRTCAETRPEENPATHGPIAGQNVLRVFVAIFKWLVEKIYGLILIALGAAVIFFFKDATFSVGFDGVGVLAGVVLVVIGSLQLFDVW